ncbi:TonB-dependent receptor plug [Sphingobium chlorophenolicum L-1]|uniref:TonB-dependent receptor plug n=1 Tax=Sphingobium chlorophenolicum L-1 TaxID=690566 RepID=F6F154_SPHCR|nr:TonB-dependent receptor [Sphingobium chlorophenolicum]AEG51270.1 TonB-dependent receptor plug [Sphingobium chlorophenolicum L-1]
MSIDRKWGLCGGVSLAALVCSPAAVAQQATPGTELGEIIVTAQRRAENMQDVPIAISVVSAEAIAAAGYKSLSDLQYLVPGVQFDPANGSGFQIRGVGTQVYDYSTEQAVSIVIDDVVYDLPRSPGIASLADIERVDVLKGPQGTLFGKNATAGVISVVTKKPKLDTYEGDISVSYGERNDRRVSAGANIPLGQIAALRVSAFHTGQDGFGRFTFLNKRAGDVRDTGIRAKLLVAPSDDLDIVLAADYSKHRDNLHFGTLISSDPAYTALSAAAGVTIGPNNYDRGDAYESYTRYSNRGVSLTANLRIGGHTLTSITAYRDLSYISPAPLDFEPTQEFLPFNTGKIDAHKFSQEVRLASPGEGRFRYVLGAYFNKFLNDSTQEQAGRLGQPLPPGVYLSLVNGKQLFHNNIQSKAVFGQFSFDITEQLELIMGGRLTHDINRAASSYDMSPLPYIYIPIAGIPDPAGRQSTTNFSYKISPTYKVGDNVRVYATYSTGYKGAGVAYLSGRKQPYGDETVKNIELGLKSELFDKTLRVNIAAFSQKYKDFQAQDIQFIGGVPTFLIVNAGGLRTRGVEVEINARPTPALSLNGGVIYSDSAFTDYLKSGVQLAGQRLTNAPRWSGLLGATLTEPVADKYQVEANISASYRSKAFLAVADPTTIQKAYTLVSARLAFGRQDGALQLGVYARNLFDQHFSVRLAPSPFGMVRGWSNETRRTVGAFVSAKY